jgi:single-stranded DNA-specific DHH superfamily exonuclease
MKFYDIFNGDADGLCALQQLRLAQPRETTLVTGVKRDIELMRRVDARDGDVLTVLDISLERNAEAARRALDAGAHIIWFDHHAPGEIPLHPAFESRIDTESTVCTSLLVDRYLEGAQRGWAIAGAFGDNLGAVAQALAEASGFSAAETDVLRRLGQCLNYNAYGDEVSELLVDPEQLSRRMRPFRDPLAFTRDDPTLARLEAAMREDMALARAVTPYSAADGVIVIVLPDEPWSRRVSGTIAHAVARDAPDHAHAVLTPGGGAFTVSIRAPLNAPQRAMEVAKRFGGGGRAGAAGIDGLPADRMDDFVSAMREVYGPR